MKKPMSCSECLGHQVCLYILSVHKLLGGKIPRTLSRHQSALRPPPLAFCSCTNFSLLPEDFCHRVLFFRGSSRHCSSCSFRSTLSCGLAAQTSTYSPDCSDSRRGGSGRFRKELWSDIDALGLADVRVSRSFLVPTSAVWGEPVNHFRTGGLLMTSTESEPLLKSGDPREEEQSEEWSQGKVKQWAQWAQYVVPSAGDGPVEVNPAEIRDAASQDPYPQWIYGALVTPTDDGRLDSVGGPPIPQAVEASLSPDILSSVQGLHEGEIRELIVEHVDHQCCWGRRPASKWTIKKVEDCNAFIGALESFIEEREVQSHVEPYSDQPYTTEEQGRPLGPWEVDMRDDFPLLFTAKKEAQKVIQFSQRVEVCKTCSGKKEVFCPACHTIDESRAVRPRKVATCSVCHGRGLIAHLDGSDTECGRCKGTGMQECKQCSSRGTVKCSTCDGYGSLLFSQVVVVRWRTLINKIISASSHAATVPDDVLHEASGIQLHCDQSHLCKPVQFPASYGLTKLSADVFLTREPVPAMARLIVERHQLRVIPVTRVLMSEGDRSFKFYVIGLDKEIYLKNYPATCALCCCLQMCSVQ